MGTNKPKLSPKEALWEEARKRYNLSTDHVRMAKALGMNPKKLGKLANTKQQPWKAPLADFIKECYRKQFDKPGRKQKSGKAAEAHHENEEAIHRHPGSGEDQP